MTALSVLIAVWFATSVPVALVVAGLVRRSEARPPRPAPAARVRARWDVGRTASH